MGKVKAKHIVDLCRATRILRCRWSSHGCTGALDLSGRLPKSVSDLFFHTHIAQVVARSMECFHEIDWDEMIIQTELNIVAYRSWIRKHSPCSLESVDEIVRAAVRDEELLLED